MFSPSSSDAARKDAATTSVIPATSARARQKAKKEAMIARRKKEEEARLASVSPAVTKQALPEEKISEEHGKVGNAKENVPEESANIPSTKAKANIPDPNVQAVQLTPLDGMEKAAETGIYTNFNSPETVPSELRLKLSSPLMSPHKAVREFIQSEVDMVPQEKSPEKPGYRLEPHVLNEEIPRAHEDVPNIPTCKDCSLPTDVVLLSSDGVLFGAHMRNLELYSGRFPAEVPSPESRCIVRVEENSTVISLLLRYMHLCAQPDPKAIAFGVLEQLANAVEKYLIYSAMAICKLRMEFYLEQHPAEILRYAAKNRYTELANEAALLTISFDYRRIKEAFGGDSDTPRRWLEFKEGWRNTLAYVHIGAPEDVPHPNPFCSWDSFKIGILKELGSFDPSTLCKVEVYFANQRVTNGGCTECEARMSEWETRITAQRDALPEFSAFL